jgi:hypothetical protein
MAVMWPRDLLDHLREAGETFEFGSEDPCQLCADGSDLNQFQKF